MGYLLRLSSMVLAMLGFGLLLMAAMELAGAATSVMFSAQAGACGTVALDRCIDAALGVAAVVTVGAVMLCFLVLGSSLLRDPYLSLPAGALELVALGLALLVVHLVDGRHDAAGGYQPFNLIRCGVLLFVVGRALALGLHTNTATLWWRERRERRRLIADTEREVERALLRRTLLEMRDRSSDSTGEA